MLDNKGWAPLPLHYGAWYGYNKIIGILINTNADIDIRTKDACQEGHIGNFDSK